MNTGAKDYSMSTWDKNLVAQLPYTFQSEARKTLEQSSTEAHIREAIDTAKTERTNCEAEIGKLE